MAAKKEEVEAIEKEAKDKHEKEWEGELHVLVGFFILSYCSNFIWSNIIVIIVLFMFLSETKTKLLAEKDRASAETAFKALDTDEDGR